MVTDKMDIGGAETHILTLSKQLHSAGHKIRLISATGVYTNTLREIGIECVSAPLDKRDIISIIKSKRILQKESKLADVVHTHTRFSSFLMKIIRKKRTYPPIVTTAHLNFPLFPFGKLAFWGDKSLAVSEDIKEYLLKNYPIKSEDIKITQNSIDTELFSPGEEKKKLIIHTSRIDTGRAKTAFLLSRIAPALLSEFSEWRIIIAGDGDLFGELKKSADEANLKLGFEGVILLGKMADIHKLLKTGSVFVGVSRAALEGMASGLATVICGDEGYGGIASNDNFNLLSSTNFCARGLPMPSDELLISDLKLLISDEKKRSELSQISRSLIEENYRAEIMAKDAEKIYLDVIKKPKAVLLGFYGFGNAGDETTLKIAIELLRSRGICDISVFYSDTEFEGGEETGVKPYDRMSLSDINNALNSADVLILPGGNLLQNETSLRSLIYYERMIKTAKRKGARVYMLSSGFGKVSGILAERIMASAIKAVDFCGCRTGHDLAIAEQYSSNARLMPDLCFKLPIRNFNCKKSFFLWVVSPRCEIFADEIIKIAKLRNLTPIALSLFKSEDSAIFKKIKSYGIDIKYAERFDTFCD